MGRKDEEADRTGDPVLLGRFRAAVAALPETDRQVFVLNASDELDYAAIAQCLGLSPEDVQRHLARALAQLAVALDEPSR